MQGSGVCLASSISPMRRLEIGLAPDSFHRGVLNTPKRPRYFNEVCIQYMKRLAGPQQWLLARAGACL